MAHGSLASLLSLPFFVLVSLALTHGSIFCFLSPVVFSQNCLFDPSLIFTIFFFSFWKYTSVIGLELVGYSTTLFGLSVNTLFISGSLELKELNTGKELEGETLPLNMGHRVYKVTGLKKSVWYEVKISYPASIPASFSIRLEREAPQLWLNNNRRLLNTEKLIFQADSFNPVYVQVTVKAAGVVAQPYAQEREVILFNIVCDELLLGITYNAWWVGIAVFLCLAFAAVTPYFLPRKKQWQQWLKYKSSQSNRRRVNG